MACYYSADVTKRATCWGPLMLLATCFIVLQTVTGSYVITTPRRWTVDTNAQVCLVVSNPSPEDQLTLNFVTNNGRDPPTILVPAGDGVLSCEQAHLPSTTTDKQVELLIQGQINGKPVNETRPINIRPKTSRTFVQTDKYLYKAGQKVQFRVLTINGPNFEVDTVNYPEIFVETPSGSRIAQWVDHPNPSGLIHLDLQLIDEPEEGVYKIKVKNQAKKITTKTFKIEDFVLPRFEVSINPPSYLLATAEILKLEVCAKYTFGQPVKGSVKLNINNNKRSRHKVEMNLLQNPIFGCKTFEIPLDTFGINDKSRFVYSLTANVDVEEEGTGTVFSSTSDIDIHRTVLTIQNLDKENSQLVKPELPTSTTVEAKFPDGSPAPLEPMKVCVFGDCRNMTTDSSGKLTYSVPPHLAKHGATVESLNYVKQSKPSNNRNFMHTSSYNSDPTLAFSPTNSSLMITPTNSRFSCIKGQTLDILLPVLYASVNTSQAVLYVQVISRGQIQYWTNMSMEFSDMTLTEERFPNLVSPILPPVTNFTIRGEFLVPISLPLTTSPVATILMWYSREDGEIVSDSWTLRMDKCLDNQVQLSWPEARVEQGTTLPLTLSAEPNSLCSLGIVDKSVELLSIAQDTLNLEQIFKIATDARINSDENSQIDDNDYCIKKNMSSNSTFDMSTDEIRFGGSEYRTEMSDALKMFDDSGVFVITDLIVETRPCIYEETLIWHRVFARPQASPGVLFDTPNRRAKPSTKPSGNDDSTRTYFPETWLWDLINVPSTGDLVQNLTLPDTITEWVGKAVCVHPSKGVGLSSTTSITTFTPFFIDLTVLPNVKNGEVMPIKISVFNYLETSLPVRIILESSPEYEILGVNGTDAVLDQSSAGMRSVCIPAGDKQTVNVRVRPLVVGNVNVIVAADVDSKYPGKCGPEVVVDKYDRIISPIIVEYEGFPREKTWNKYMCSKDINENLDFFEEWHLEAPANIVPESERAWVTVAGDLLGPSLENLGHLIRMPSGCGEQNMIKFAPNIYVRQYLEASTEAPVTILDKLTKFMKRGYQRELTYKHDDGSYSAFGKRDDSGSTWLTAFVVKSYAQAVEYVSVDLNEIAMSTSWLKKRQLKNGCFESVGKVLHKEMIGGLTADGERSEVLLSAYVMAALLEAGTPPTDKVITNAVSCLKASNGTKSSDPYELALVAYALSVAQLPESDEVISRLMELSINTPVGLYWKHKGKGSTSDDSISAVDVETAGYVLMAMVTRNPVRYVESSHRITKWISLQRNGQGGFISTQDTVVALQALAWYENLQSQELKNLMITATGQGVSAKFKVNETNKLLTQRAEIPTVPTKLLLDMTGDGCALVQAVVRYNVKDPEPSMAFNMSVSTSAVSGSKKTHKIRVCASYLLNDGESNMAVIEVALVSGFIPVKADLKKVVGSGTGIFKRYEVDGNKVFFYVDHFKATETCAEFNVVQEVEVENAKPGTVKVYDYYAPEFSISEKFELTQPDFF